MTPNLFPVLYHIAIIYIIASYFSKFCSELLTLIPQDYHKMDNQSTRKNQHEAMLIEMIEKDIKARTTTTLLDRYYLNPEVAPHTSYLNKYPKTEEPASNFLWVTEP